MNAAKTLKQTAIQFERRFRKASSRPFILQGLIKMQTHSLSPQDFQLSLSWQQNWEVEPAEIQDSQSTTAAAVILRGSVKKRNKKSVFSFLCLLVHIKAKPLYKFHSLHSFNKRAIFYLPFLLERERERAYIECEIVFRQLCINR